MGGIVNRLTTININISLYFVMYYSFSISFLFCLTLFLSFNKLVLYNILLPFASNPFGSLYILGNLCGYSLNAQTFSSDLLDYVQLGISILQMDILLAITLSKEYTIRFRCEFLFQLFIPLMNYSYMLLSIFFTLWSLLFITIKNILVVT